MNHAILTRTALVLALASLAGCGIVPKKEPIALYSPEATVQPDPSWPNVRWQLQITRPHANELIDSPRIVVRPATGELQVYHAAIWAEPAPDLVQDAVLRAFEDSGKIQGVGRRGTGIAGDYELALDLRRFESDYAGGATPNADIEVVVKLIAPRTNSVIATKTIRQRVPAGGTAVGAVAAAFDTALTNVVQDIVGWTFIEAQKYDVAHPRPPVVK
ncbi:ABC transporter [Lysobacter helvus]|uniref:ABC transporter n=2 Tax=Lysobacteraceae TaxID=32033 RepID=A0ABM7Q3I4_9GAMM|nr:MULTISPECIES: ABC-type transport auxiliary lipoprotein family protein [Lysobacter]BCT91824.1 ABC transporter [Lysobacter caseinilyticus]BCT94977.1 ABC transporter [Lysobacter helvus]